MAVRITHHSDYLDNYQVDIQLIPILLRMGRRGIKLRQPVLESWQRELGRQINIYRDICAEEGFDPSKPQQVGYMLALRGNILPFTDRSQKRLKTDEKTLKRVDDPLAAVVLNFRKHQKLKGTYIDPCIGKDRFYTNFRMDLSTSRLASYERNIQNIPPAVREIFEPDTGTWTWMDWSQIEMRIFAHITKDPVMLDAYATGKDIHTITQLALWPDSDPADDVMRGRAKTFNFAMIYYAFEGTLADETGLPRELCKRYRSEWLDLYHEARRWMEYMKEEGPSKGWVETLFGRRLRLPDPTLHHPYHIEKCAINYPVQGTAAGVIARGMLLGEQLKWDMVVQLHDELVIDGDVDPPEQLAHILPDVYLPFSVKRGPVWI